MKNPNNENASSCSSNCSSDIPKKHLAIIGGGSAAFAATTKASELGHDVSIINSGLPIGGTCVNVGCVPSKTLIRAAEAYANANAHAFNGFSTSSTMSDFSQITNQANELVETLRQAKYLDVVSDIPGVKIIDGRARLITPQELEVNGEEISADYILIATGTRPYIANVPGLDDVDYLDNESALQLKELPKSMIVLGGRYIALEIAQMFARFGTKVTILQRSGRILPTESETLTQELTEYLKEEGIEVVTGMSLTQVSESGGKVKVEGNANGTPVTFKGEKVLVATGRSPNTEELGLEQCGIETTANGHIKVDKYLRTTAPNVFAAGDVIGEPEFVYTAAYEGNLAATNALSDTLITQDYTALPWVIFTDPQVAGVGLDESQALAQGLNVDVSFLPLKQVPRAIAARNTKGFIQLIRQQETDQLVGARILAHEGSELLMELSLAIKHNITVTELKNSFHAYLTLGEGVKLAALAFGKDPSKLSCCAV